MAATSACKNVIIKTISKLKDLGHKDFAEMPQKPSKSFGQHLHWNLFVTNQLLLKYKTTTMGSLWQLEENLEGNLPEPQSVHRVGPYQAELTQQDLNQEIVPGTDTDSEAD